MFDCKKNYKDCISVGNLPVNYSSNDIRWNSFFVSASTKNRSFTIEQDLCFPVKRCCAVPPQKIDAGDFFCVENEIKADNDVVVTSCESKNYKIAKYISNSIYITINALKNVLKAINIHIKKFIKNMKGHTSVNTVYTLCLLRL